MARTSSSSQFKTVSDEAFSGATRASASVDHSRVPVPQLSGIALLDEPSALRLLESDTDSAAPVSAVRPQAAGEPLYDVRAIVKSFNEDKGWGFLVDSAGVELFVHYKEIVGEGRRTLAVSESVFCDVVRGPKGHLARNVRRCR
jgi:cold shock protein